MRSVYIHINDVLRYTGYNSICVDPIVVCMYSTNISLKISIHIDIDNGFLFIYLSQSKTGGAELPRCLIGGQTARSCPSSFRLAGSRGEIRGPSACWDDGVWEIEIERQIPSIWAKSTPQKKTWGGHRFIYIEIFL